MKENEIFRFKEQNYNSIDRKDGSKDSADRLNDSSPLCDSDSLLGPLLTRYQVNFQVYFTVCRQLWWHYVNIAGT